MYVLYCTLHYVQSAEFIDFPACVIGPMYLMLVVLEKHKRDLLSILMSVFPGGGWTWVSRYQNVSILDCVGAKDDGDGEDNWSYKTCKAPVKLPPPTYQHPTIYRPDVLPVAQPTMLKHWRENKRVYICQIFFIHLWLWSMYSLYGWSRWQFSFCFCVCEQENSKELWTDFNEIFTVS